MSRSERHEGWRKHAHCLGPWRVSAMRMDQPRLEAQYMAGSSLVDGELAHTTLVASGVLRTLSTPLSACSMMDYIDLAWRQVARENRPRGTAWGAGKWLPMAACAAANMRSAKRSYGPWAA